MKTKKTTLMMKTVIVFLGLLMISSCKSDDMEDSGVSSRDNMEFNDAVKT